MLEALGRPVASLTIVDSEAPSGVRRERTRVEILMELVKLYELGGQRPTGLTRADLEGREPDEQLACLHAALVQAGLMSSRSVPSTIHGAVSVFETALRVAYRPRTALKGRLTLIFASRIGVIDPRTYSKYRAYFLVGALFAAAVLTPGPDVYSQVLMTIPMLVLYEIGALIARWTAKPRRTR